MMITLQELTNRRKTQLENRNGTEALLQRINEMEQLRGNNRMIAALKLKGYIEALYELQYMTYTDTCDWLHIIETKYKGVN
ncbi:hypothetical protein [Acinetobacter towneri]|uniref:hypothetical protein n=1 Tax=Acinetobacter towneri TaxID=202956 RepID=UPI003A8C2580